MRVGKEDESLPSQQSQQELPASYETEPDATGMRLAVSYRWAGQGADRHMEKVRQPMLACLLFCGVLSRHMICELAGNKVHQDGDEDHSRLESC